MTVTNLMDLATETVLHNLAEGIILVTVNCNAFYGRLANDDYRKALLFRFAAVRIYMHAHKGMTANLLSMGAVDFGIIIDGAVVMVEVCFVALDTAKRERSGVWKSSTTRQLICSKIPGQKWQSHFSFKAHYYHLSYPHLLFHLKSRRQTVFPLLAWTLVFALLRGCCCAIHLYQHSAASR